jgi:hypothetical protein
MQPYRSYFPHAGLLLPETKKITQKELCELKQKMRSLGISVE